MIEADDRNIEKLVDEVILESLDLEPHVKATTAITLETHRALKRLQHGGDRSIEEMDRSFLIQHFSGRSIKEMNIHEIRRRVETALDSDNPIKQIKLLIKDGI